MADPIKILLAHDDEAVQQAIDDALDGVEYSCSEVVTSCSELRTACYERRPDVVISAVQLRDGDAIRVLVEVGYDCPVPTIVVTDRESLRNVERALQDHVMAYLLQPIDSEQIKPTIYLVLKRFEQFQALQDEVDDLKQAIADRKLIERAKGVLMGDAEVDEAAAFRMLQQSAMSGRAKLVDAARRVLEEHQDHAE